MTAVKKGETLSYTLNYVLQDSLGSTSASVDSAGSTTSTIRYFSFGAARYTTGALPTDKTFTGQRLDGTGLYYYGARYYDPAIGRFISPDTIVQSPANPQTLNRYSYCLNNPLVFIDPSGHDVYVNGNNVSEYYNFVEMMGLGIFTTPTTAVINLVGDTIFAIYDAMRSADSTVAFSVETNHNIKVNVKFGSVSDPALYGELSENGTGKVDLILNGKSADMANLVIMAGNLGHEIYHCWGITMDIKNEISGSYFEETMCFRYQGYITTKLGGIPTNQNVLMAGAWQWDNWDDLAGTMTSWYKGYYYDTVKGYSAYPTSTGDMTMYEYRDEFSKYVLALAPNKIY